MSSIESNIWKFFIFSLTQRRSYWTFLSIYFLTLPNTTAQMIGLYTGIGNLVGFFLEIPSGYFADKFGHKQTLVLAKFLVVCSTICFMFLQSFSGFLIGFILFIMGFAFTSGTSSAFIHETLGQLGREKEYTKTMSRIQGSASVISALLIITVPFFTAISFMFALGIGLVIDVIGLFFACLLVSPKVHKDIFKVKPKSILQIFKESRALNFLPFSIFLGGTFGFLHGETAFRYVYLENLGFPIILMGLVMGTSRLLWFGVSFYIHKIEERFSMKQLLLFELFLFPAYFLLAAVITNKYYFAISIIIILGYVWGRNSLMESYLITNCIPDKRYKATVLSISGQVKQVFTIITAFGMGFLVMHSFRFSYLLMGVALFVVLLFSYVRIEEK